MPFRRLFKRCYINNNISHFILLLLSMIYMKQREKLTSSLLLNGSLYIMGIVILIFVEIKAFKSHV
ncbi:hypothetical protein BD408DRAFT_63021 [Parasitella parasitica]|nr:hypothetical protein BD408DRAFT_63021 [Parasitella parasitica]